MQQAIEVLSWMDRNNDFDKLVPYLQSRQFTLDQVEQILVSMITSGSRGRPPFLLAQILVNGGADDWTVRLIQAFCGFEIGENEAGATALAALNRHLANLSPDLRVTCFDDTKNLLVMPLLDAFKKGDETHILNLLEIWKALEPPGHKIFDDPSAAGPLALDRIRQNSKRSGRLLTFEARPDGSPRAVRRCILAAPKNYMWQNIAAAANNYGWPMELYEACCFDNQSDHDLLHRDHRNIADLCRESRADVLILQEYLLWRKDFGASPEDIRHTPVVPTDMLAALRQDLPDLKVVSLWTDAWVEPKHAAMKIAAEAMDAIWVPFPSMPLLEEPSFAGKVMKFPLPINPPNRAAAEPLGSGSRLTFLGRIGFANWSRAFWLPALRQAGVDIVEQLSSNADDDAPDMENYRRYLARIGQAGACLNFSLRTTLVRTLTLRTLEIMAMGGLLVQEQADDVDHYLLAGEHYLPFTTLSDLVSIARFIAERPDEAEEIRQRGDRFYQEHYNDMRLMSYLDQHLYRLSNKH